MRDIDEDAWHAYHRYLKAQRLSDNTIASYRVPMEHLSAVLPPEGLFGATAAQVGDWLAGLAGRDDVASSTHAAYFRRLKTFYKWAAESEYLDGPSPMARMKPPKQDQTVIPVPDVAHLLAVLDACKGKDFRARRDLAIVRVMLETGTPRAAAVAALRKDNVDLRRDEITVMDKGRKERVIPFGAKAGHALMLYMRARAAHKHAAKPELFLGPRGPMTRDGVYHAIELRCRQAGVPVISPHKWRHFTADRWFDAGGSEGDAMALFGWSTPAMAHHYARAAAGRRAQKHARDLALGDQL